MMKTTIVIAIASTLMLLAPTGVLAQTVVKSIVQPEAKSAKAIAPAARLRTAKASRRTPPAGALPDAGDSVAAALSPAELAIAERVHVGRIPCELGAFVTVTADPATAGHFHVEGKGFKYHMSPVLTSTGAVRLEDVRNGAVWLQIANKSMLMNQRLGQRLADECMGPEQFTATQAFRDNPPVNLLEPLPAAK
ncbi:hypothetical protein D8B23_03950 [Verminephrobacter aporrectodeae subsp. tuberculatae]|uniref:hypothetical protein n=1 Tax=Verminephrobacter aporrectodeae TaxID=1110389 RepID=UPI003908B68F|nr:hypothetical protein [Verminephrobacter aporrectodeae subsp. tuberculatae]